MTTKNENDGQAVAVNGVTAPVVDEGPKQHVLVTKMVWPENNFEAWKARWDKAEVITDLMGLLHGLGSSDGDPIWTASGGIVEAVLFLLDLADGYESKSGFSQPKEAASFDDVRHALAVKAFKVLANRLFGPVKKDCNRNWYPWWWILSNEKILDKIEWFFRSESYYWRPILRNITRPESMTKLQNELALVTIFLDSLARLGWNYQRMCQVDELNFDGSINTTLVKRRPFFLLVLEWLGKLNWFFSDIFGYENPVDMETIELLESLAMSRKYYLPCDDSASKEYRSPKDFKEVISVSNVARVALILRTMNQQFAEWRRANAEASERRDAANQAETVKGIEEQITVLSQRLAELRGQATTPTA